MSGRDLRNFVLAHRAEARETGQLVQRVTDGLYSSKYKAVDYEALKAMAQKKKFEGQAALVKVKKLQDASKKTKEQNLVNQHKGVWQKELLRLNNLQRKLEAEMAYNLNQAGAAAKEDPFGLRATFEDLESQSETLTKQRQKFKEETYDPVMELRNDLSDMASMKSCTNPDEVLEEVDRVKSQHAALQNRLSHQVEALEQELVEGDLPTIHEIQDFCNYSRLAVETGIPEAAFDMPCPDSEFKASVLQEFIFIDQRYVLKLEALEEEHSTIARSATGAWSAAEHEVFVYCSEQYSMLQTQRHHRMLAIDMMRRLLPHRTRAEIVAHEEWWMHFQHYHRRTKALLVDWLRERGELVARARALFAEMTAAHEQRVAKQLDKQRQREICDALYSKVSQWREEKQEMMKLQEEMEKRRRQEQMEAIEREEAKEKAKRDKQKQKIQAFKAERTKEEEAKAQRDQERLEELRKMHEEQAKIDKERVLYREKQFLEKQQDQAEKERQKQLDREEREAVLEALREKVRPHVEGDLLRLWSDTKTWQAHMKADEEFINIQQPLYNINTFTAKQIAADSRVRLDNELRSLGLQNHPHARHMMAAMPPPRQPRPDMASTVLKFDN